MSTAVDTESAVVGIDLLPTSIDDEGRGAEFTVRDGSTFAVWSGSMFGKTSGSCPMLAVSDITSAAATYRERGLALSDIHETPTGSMAFGEDPDGNTLIIHQRKESDDPHFISSNDRSRNTR